MLLCQPRMTFCLVSQGFGKEQYKPEGSPFFGNCSNQHLAVVTEESGPKQIAVPFISINKVIKKNPFLRAFENHHIIKTKMSSPLVFQQMQPGASARTCCDI